MKIEGLQCMNCGLLENIALPQPFKAGVGRNCDIVS